MTKKIVPFELNLKSSRRSGFTSRPRPQIFTNDANAAELNFIITDTSAEELAGTTATVLLFMKDGSFFQDTDVTRVNNTFVYTIKPNQAKHKGVAQAQLVIKIGTVENASPLMEFEIIGGLETKPIVEREIQDWTSLTAEAKAFVEQIEDFTLAEFVENKMGQELANLEVNYATRLTGLEAADQNITAQLDQIAVNVKNFGVKGDGVTDDTIAFNLAVANTPTGGVLMIPEGTYMINGDDNIGIGISKPMSLVFNNGAILKKIPTNVTQYAIVSIKNTEKVTIEGQGILIGDRDEHTGTTGEWGTGIKVLESKDIIIRDISLKDFWGDGIYINGPQSSAGPYGGYSRNILIDNVAVDNVRRNGMSILDCIGVTIRNCRVTNTNGTMPNSGIDIEPNYRIADQIVIEGCYFSGNAVQDIVGGGGKGVRGISITNCEFDSTGISVNINGTPSESIENVSITNCTIMAGNTAFGFSNVNTLALSNISLSIDPTKIENNTFSAFSLRENITNATIDNVKFLSSFYVILNVLDRGNINFNISIRNCSINGVGFDVIRGAAFISALTLQGNTFKDCRGISANAITTSVQNNTFLNSRLSLSRASGASVIANNFYGDSPTLSNFIRGNFLEDSEIIGNTFKYTATGVNFYVIQAPENTYTDAEGVVRTRSKPNVILNNAMVGVINNVLLNPIDISQGNYTKP